MILHIRALEATGVPKKDIIGLSDPYLMFELSTSSQQWKTKYIKNTKEPVWNDEFHLPITSLLNDVLHVSLWDKDDISKDDLISTIEIKVKNKFPLGKIIDEWYYMRPSKGTPEGGKIRLLVQLSRSGQEPFSDET